MHFISVLNLLYHWHMCVHHIRIGIYNYRLKYLRRNYPLTLWPNVGFKHYW